MNINGQYAEDLTYDKNGNITTLQRYGQEENGQPIEIDDLTYAYTGNQLQSVTDATNNPEGFNDGNKTGNDYVYDSFGNITQDKNKKITNAKYNHQNLPTEVVFNTGKINYTYDAAGTRLKKQVVPTSAATETTDYINGFQYVDNVLKFFPHPEGYVEFKNKQYLYTYQYKDHLGNVRLTYRDGYKNHPTEENPKNGTIEVTEIIEENNYYPFGLKHKGYNELADYSATNKYKYAYSGMEWQPELGLDLYDFGARNYDPAIGRWLNVDPLAENSRRWTPYNYAYNNPIFFIDPDGMQATKFDDLDDVIKFMNNGSIERISTNDDFDILTNQSGDMNLKIEHKNGKSQIGEIQEIQLNNNKIQYMFIKDNDVARDVFEFAAQTTANPTSNAEFGLDMFDFSDGFSMNLFQTGEISAKGLPNVTPLGQIGEIDLGNNHFIKNSNWIETNHSHPKTNPLTPSGFSRYFRNGNVVFEPNGMGDRTFRNGSNWAPQNMYLYGAHTNEYIKYDFEKAVIIGNRR